MSKQDDQQNPKTRLTWESPKLKRVGDLEDIVRGGGGKVSVAGQDPGDIRKPSGQG
jgi:hypothetical protein